MPDYTIAAANAAKTLKGKGAPVTLRKDISINDPVTGESRQQYKTATGHAVFLPASGGTIQAFDRRFTDEVVRGDIVFVLVSAMSLEPAPGDELVEASGREWLVLGNTPLKVDGTTTIINQMGLRKKGVDLP